MTVHSIFFHILLFSSVVLLMICTYLSSNKNKELFACNYTYKLPATSKGCFQYHVKAGDTCQSIQDLFRTDQNLVRSVVGNNICTDETATIAGSRNRAPPPPLTEGDAFRICPPHDCVYHKLRYPLTCGELATRYNTHHSRIHYYKPSTPGTMHACTDADNQRIPKDSRAKICRDASMDNHKLLGTADPTTYDDCKARCHQIDQCAHIMYGNGVCKLLSGTTPLMNIQSSSHNANAYQCAAEAKLIYAGATPNEIGRYHCDNSNLAPCKWLGGQGCDSQSKCIPPHTNAPTDTSQTTFHRERRCPWESIVQNQSELMVRQKDYSQTNDFLAEVCR